MDGLRNAPPLVRRLLERYGKVPVEARAVSASLRTLEELRAVEGGNLGAAALLWNPRGQVLLVRHRRPTTWGDRWVAPGGSAKPGELPEETLIREVLEEAGLRAEILDLTKVFQLTVTDGRRDVRGYFFQFEALAGDNRPSAGPGIAEARWFDSLPKDMAYREDYLEAFRRRKSSQAGGTSG